MAGSQSAGVASDQLLREYAQELGYGLSTVLMGSQETLASDVAALLNHRGWTFKPYVWEFAPIDERVAEDRVRLIAEVTAFLSDIWCPDTNTIREMIDIAGIALDVVAVVPVGPESERDFTGERFSGEPL